MAHNTCLTLAIGRINIALGQSKARMHFVLGAAGVTFVYQGAWTTGESVS